MFKEARIKLTVWYVIISMIVSALFSLAIFSRLHRDFALNQRRSELRFQQIAPFIPNFDDRLELQRQDTSELEERLLFNLLLINVAVWVLSALAGYFLAGKTLEPIKEVVDKQNRFIADASHELRTPLTAMKTSIEVNLRDKNLNTTSAKKVLRENLQDIDNMRQLSDNLLSLARLHENKPTRFKKVSLQKIIEKSVTNVANSAKLKNIKIEQSLKNVPVTGNQEQLVELFSIFLDNAVKYSPEKSKITIALTKQNDFVETVIKDTGIGISEADMQHIFERFYRVDKSRSHSDTDGYGLGLAIAREIVDAHNGSISVKSRLKKGTTFSIKLPTK